MRKQIWRMAAAVVGAVALAAAAAAQTPTPMPPAVVQPIAPTPAPAGPVVGGPAVAAPPVHVHPAPAPGHVVPAPMHVAPAPVVGGGCAPGADCGTGGKYGGKWADKAFIGVGTANPVGCGCCASEKTFFWGSCKQFFTPGKRCDGSPTLYNGCGGNCAGLFGGRAPCPPPPYAWPYGQPANNCCGPFSYLDR